MVVLMLPVFWHGSALAAFKLEATSLKVLCLSSWLARSPLDIFSKAMPIVAWLGSYA